MPKRKQHVPAVPVRPARRRVSARVDAERRNQLLLVGLVVVALIGALAIALFGYYQTKVAPKGEAVLQVGERKFSLAYFERRARYEVRRNNTILTASGEQAAEYLVALVQREELVRQSAAEKDVTITDEDVDNEIRRVRFVPENADHNVFAAAYREAVRESGLSTGEYRDTIASQLLEVRLHTQFESEVPDAVEQARYRIIQVPTVEQAETVLSRLEAGEDFGALARELSTDLATKDLGGEAPWAARGTLDEALEEAVFGLEQGQRSGVIEIAGTAVVVEVLERDAGREPSEEQRTALGSRAFDDWLAGLRDSAQIRNFLKPEQALSILQAVADEARRSA